MSSRRNKHYYDTSTITIAVVGIVTAVALTVRWYSKLIATNDDSRKDAENDDDHPTDDGDDNTTNKLPQHLQRLIYKEKRRKESIRFLAMKSPMYDNITMYGPDGSTLLCTISSKKANWYIRKKLATWYRDNNNNNKSTEEEETTKSIKLNFEPKPKGNLKVEPDVYTISQKHNICVCCGDTSGDYMRHYIVPYCYRTLLPSKYKSHMSHDIVILCPDCNLTCKQLTQKRQKSIENSLRKNPHTAIKVIPNPRLNQIKSKALALLNHRDQLPDDRRIEYEQLVRTYNKLSEEKEELTIKILQQTSTMDTTIPNPSYISGPQLVIDHLNQNDQIIAEFIRDWRIYFIDTMQPRSLPKGWDISNPVHCDD